MCVIQCLSLGAMPHIYYTARIEAGKVSAITSYLPMMNNGARSEVVNSLSREGDLLHVNICLILS